MFIDLTPYMNLSAFSVHHSTHALRIHRLFRAMGLRHLTVVNSKNKVNHIFIYFLIGKIWVHMRSKKTQI